MKNSKESETTIKNMRFTLEDSMGTDYVRKISDLKKRVESIQEILDEDISFWKHPDSNIYISEDTTSQHEISDSQRESRIRKRIFEDVTGNLSISYELINPHYRNLRGLGISHIIYNRFAIKPLEQDVSLNYFKENEQGIIVHLNPPYEELLNIPDLRKKFNIVREIGKKLGYVIKEKPSKHKILNQEYGNPIGLIDKLSSKTEKEDYKKKEGKSLGTLDGLKEFFPQLYRFMVQKSRIKKILIPLTVILNVTGRSINPSPPLPPTSMEERIEVKQERTCPIIPQDYFKGILGILNYCELTNSSVLEILKSHNPTTSKISRNYSDIHKTQLKNNLTFLKIYQDNPELKEKEIKILTLLKDKKINVPQWYCHGNIYLGPDFMLQERIEGITIDKYLKRIKNKDSHKKRDLLEKILDSVVEIGIEGYVNNLPTLYGKLTKQKIAEWLRVGIINKLKTERSEDLMQRIEDDYDPISKILLDSPFLYNKDIPTKNWLMRKDGMLYVIDFENTHLGPIQLDLVTLFEGKNGFKLEENELIAILKYICEKMNDYIKKKDKNLPKFEEEEFIKTYFAASVHRNLSMAGTNKEKGDERQMIKHLENAKHSIEKLQNFIRNRKEKEALKKIENTLSEIRLSYLQ